MKNKKLLALLIAALFLIPAIPMMAIAEPTPTPQNAATPTNTAKPTAAPTPSPSPTFVFNIEFEDEVYEGSTVLVSDAQGKPVEAIFANPEGKAYTRPLQAGEYTLTLIINSKTIAALAASVSDAQEQPITQPTAEPEQTTEPEVTATPTNSEIESEPEQTTPTDAPAQSGYNIPISPWTLLLLGVGLVGAVGYLVWYQMKKKLDAAQGDDEPDANTENEDEED